MECNDDASSCEFNNDAQRADAAALLKHQVDEAIAGTNKAQKLFHASISKFGKAIDKTIPIDEDFYAIGREMPLNANAMLHLIRAHLLHRGFYRTANEVSKEIYERQAAQPKEPKEPFLNCEVALGVADEVFREAVCVADSVRGGDIASARLWAEKNSIFLRGPKCAVCHIEFQLMRLEFVRLLHGWTQADSTEARTDKKEKNAAYERGRRRAITYARREFGKFASKNAVAVKELAGALLWAGWTTHQCNSDPCIYRRTVGNIDEQDELRSSKISRDQCLCCEQSPLVFSPYPWLAPDVLEEEVCASILAAGAELAIVLAEKTAPTSKKLSFFIDPAAPTLSDHAKDAYNNFEDKGEKDEVGHSKAGASSLLPPPPPPDSSLTSDCRSPSQHSTSYQPPAGACSHLALAFSAGQAALPQLRKMHKLVAMSNLQEWRGLGELPVEYNFRGNVESLGGADFRDFHSIFSCPVSRDESSYPDNPPVMLPCGHVICKASMERLPRSIGGGRFFKCPTCPMEVAPSQVRVLYF